MSFCGKINDRFQRIEILYVWRAESNELFCIFRSNEFLFGKKKKLKQIFEDRDKKNGHHDAG